MAFPHDPYRELASIIARFTTGDEECPTAIGNLFFSQRSSPKQCVHTAQWPCFALVVQGAKSLTLGSDVYRYGSGDYLVVSLDLPVVSRVVEASAKAPNLGLGMRIEPDRLKELLARIRIARPAIVAGDMRAVAVNKAAPDLLDAVVRLLRLLDRPEDIPALAPLIEQEILYRVATGPFGPSLLQIAMIETPTNKIAEAVAWLRQNFTEPLRIEELAGRVRHEHVLATPPFQVRHRHDAHAVPEATSPPRSAPPDAGGTPGCGNGGLQCRIREPITVQPRVQLIVWPVAAARIDEGGISNRGWRRGNPISGSTPFPDQVDQAAQERACHRRTGLSPQLFRIAA